MISPELHGGLSLKELREAQLDPAAIIDFSVNVNPYGPSPAVRAALAALDPARYPDREALALCEALAGLNGLNTDNILAGNGTAELIWLCAHAFLKPGDPALVVGPTFGEYERAARAVGAQATVFTATPPDFALDLDGLIKQIEALQPRLIFLCNPNNPTGLLLSDDEVSRIAAASGRHILIVDEAYRGFVLSTLFGRPLTPNMIVLRSMTKDHSLAALRLGYALADRHLIEAMRAFQPPWSVSGPAQVAGLACLGDLKYLYLTLALTRSSAAALRADLAAGGARLTPAETNFILIEVGDAAGVRARLRAKGCLVRNCASFGLPGHIRIGARRPAENNRLVEAWKSVADELYLDCIQ